MTCENEKQSKRVWDLFVRMFHWSLVSCILLNYFVLEDGTLHEWMGYAASALVVMRMVWGFVGPQHARFSDFFPTPARLRSHVVALAHGKPLHYWGHNPLGALMILALMGLVLALGLTGWMQSLDPFFGVEWVQDLHEGLATVLITFAGVHAAMAILMGRIERTRLVKAMVTGTKERW